MRRFSADSFFTSSTGVYVFDKTKIGEAHGHCLRSYVLAIQDGARRVTIMRGLPGSGKSAWVANHAADLDVVVDNTSLSVAEVAPYASLAQAYGIPFQIVTMKLDLRICAERNTHGVSHAKIRNMAACLGRGTRQLMQMPWWPNVVVRGDEPLNPPPTTVVK